ncbi:MAG TPA: SemiSWEET transporter [Vicinamibacterales bacterium]|jgi:MtN3 and saliva related transmembrane protein|nr:SemiSWEET transporter [Vicinamibacterales bacterium]
MVQTIGFIAGTLTALAFLPQVLKTWRTRSSGDLSIGMLLAQSLGVFLWLFYGMAIRSWPVVMSNSVTLTLTLILLACKVSYSARQ